MVTLNSYIDLINKEDENVVDQSIDYSYFKFFDPKYTQNTNMFFMKSEFSLSDNVFDVFGKFETYNSFIESNKQHDYFKQIA